MLQHTEAASIVVKNVKTVLRTSTDSVHLICKKKKIAN
jgi:hypothetical protein